MDLNVDIVEAVPSTFIRGQALEFVMELPQTVEANWFANSEPETIQDPEDSEIRIPNPDYISCLLNAELYRIEHAGEGGFVANLNPVWETGSNFTKIRFLVATTDTWPLGKVEFDVLFTRTTATGTKTFRSLPVRFTIVDGVYHAPEA